MIFNFSYSNFSVHIKLHVPQIIKKHTHTRTIFKHHYKQPKFASAKSLTSSRLDPTIKLSRKNPHSFSEGGRFRSEDQLWKPSLNEYRSVESSYVPKKLKLNKKKNPFKLLEIMAEAQAEGHTFNPQSLYHNEDYSDNDGNEHIPDYMLSETPRFSASLYGSDHVGRNSGHKTDLLRLHSHSDEKLHSPSSSFVPSWGFGATKPESSAQTFDWTGISNSYKKKPKLFTPSSLESDESAIIAPKKKLRNKHRVSPTLEPTDDYAKVLKLSRKPAGLTNFTKYKNKFNVMSNLNTSI